MPAAADRLVRFDPEGLKEGDVVYMSPDEYLKLSPPMKANPVKDAKGRELRESVDQGDAIRAPASLKISVEDGVGKVMGQDGRHRAQLAKDEGIKLIPVKIDKKGEGDFDRVVGMRGEEIAWEAKRPRKWGDIAAEPRFKQMTVEDQNKARARYFDEVIAPTMPAAAAAPAREKWNAVKSKATTGPETRTDPTADMGKVETFRAGAGKAFVDTFARGPGSAVGLVSPEEVEASRKRDAPLMRTDAGALGNVAGNMAAFAPTAFVPGANTVAGSMTLGSLAGLLQPATSGSERFSNTLTGGVTAGAVTGAARALPMVKGAFIDPFTQGGQQRIALDTLSRFAHDKDALGKLNVNELVPGSKPSLAEATGDPGIAQLQRSAQAKMPEVASAFADVRTQRLAARKDALATVAGSQGEREFFEAARDATAERLYSKAFKTPIDPKKLTPKVQSEISELMERPSMKKAVADSFQLAKEEGIALTEDPKDYVQRLHYTKKALDRQIDQAMGKEGAIPPEAILKTKEKLLGVIDKVSPKYAEARAEYQAASQPLNRMEIGRYLEDKLLPALNDFGTERYRPESFAKALRDGDEMAKKATGFKGAKLADILTADQTMTLKSIAEDLGREAAAGERAKVAGSPTAQYLAGANLLRKIAGPLGLPESWVESTLGKTLARAGSAVGSVADDKIAAQLGRFLTDPASAQAAAAARAPLALPFGNNKSIPLSEIGRLALPPAAVGSGAYATQ